MTKEVRFDKYPEVVRCLECGGGSKDFVFLPTHLRRHHAMRVEEYQEDYGEDVDLITRRWMSNRIFVSSREANKARMSKIGHQYNEYRREIISELEQKGLYTTGVAARKAETRQTTIGRAISTGRIETYLFCLLYPTDSGVKPLPCEPVHLITDQALTSYIKGFRPRKRRS